MSTKAPQRQSTPLSSGMDTAKTTRRRSRVAIDAAPALAGNDKSADRAEIEAKVTKTFGEDIGRSGVVINTLIAQTFAKGIAGETNFTDVLDAVVDSGRNVEAGRLGSVEKMLHGQLLALNAIFGECARRSGLNMGVHMDASESYMRLALKAQSQCARTAEVLGNLRAGPTIFAKQANVTTGPQQINNGAMPTALAPAQEEAKPKNELLEGIRHERERMDARASAAPARSNTTMETLAAVDRAEDRGRQAAVEHE